MNTMTPSNNEKGVVVRAITDSSKDKKESVKELLMKIGDTDENVIVDALTKLKAAQVCDLLDNNAPFCFIVAMNEHANNQDIQEKALECLERLVLCSYVISSEIGHGMEAILSAMKSFRSIAAIQISGIVVLRDIADANEGHAKTLATKLGLIDFVVEMMDELSDNKDFITEALFFCALLAENKDLRFELVRAVPTISKVCKNKSVGVYGLGYAQEALTRITKAWGE